MVVGGGPGGGPGGVGEILLQFQPGGPGGLCVRIDFTCKRGAGAEPLNKGKAACHQRAGGGGDVTPDG